MARDQVVISHWYHLAENLQESSQQFYSLLEETIKKRNLPEVRLSRVDYKEGGIFSAKREYLRVERKEYIFDVCAAPFGNNFFISWWLSQSEKGALKFLLVIPFIGEPLLRALKPPTYYNLDTSLMFQESVGQAVLEVFDSITAGKGVRSLSESERKPILRDLFKK